MSKTSHSATDKQKKMIIFGFRIHVAHSRQPTLRLFTSFSFYVWLLCVQWPLNFRGFSLHGHHRIQCIERGKWQYGFRRMPRMRSFIVILCSHGKWHYACRVDRTVVFCVLDVGLLVTIVYSIWLAVQPSHVILMIICGVAVFLV